MVKIVSLFFRKLFMMAVPCPTGVACKHVSVNATFNNPNKTTYTPTEVYTFNDQFSSTYVKDVGSGETRPIRDPLVPFTSGTVA